jgi:histidinol-phosphatase (PHP family)
MPEPENISPDLNLDVDWHVHTAHSCDSKIRLDDACRAMNARGLKGICFTEHIDFDPRDVGYNWFHWDKYVKDINSIKKKYPGAVFTGFELNWQSNLAPALLDFLDGKTVNLVLGSVHWLKSGHICEKATFENLTLDAFLDEWIFEALDLLRRDICQGFAHFDYFFLTCREFYPDLKREEIFDLTLPVIDIIIDKGVSLEVNSRVMRKGLDEPCPSWSFIEKFIQAGGTKLHYGSDSHALDEIGFEHGTIRKRIESMLERYA